MNYEKIFYLNHLKRNYVVFDLGANKGYFTKLFCNIVGPFGEVHAFEPVKDTFLENIRGFSGNTPANLKLHNLAVGDRNTNIEILVPAGDYGQASLKSHKTGSWHVGQFEQVLCKMIRLDDYIQENSISVIDFIKCDIEGAELLALKGMNKSLKSFKPKLLLEVNDQWTEAFDYTSYEILEFLKGVGYKSFFKIDKRASLLSDRDHKNLSQFADGANIFCI